MNIQKISTQQIYCNYYRNTIGQLNQHNYIIKENYQNQDLHFVLRNKISTKVKYLSHFQTSKFTSDYLFLFTQQYQNFFTILDGHTYKPIQNIFVNCSIILNAAFSLNYQFLVHICYCKQLQPQTFLYVYGFSNQTKKFTQKPIDIYQCEDCKINDNKYYYIHFYNNTRLYVSYQFYGTVILFNVIQIYDPSQNYQKKYFIKSQQKVYYNATQQIKKSTFILSISDIKQSQTLIISGQQDKIQKMKMFSIPDNHKKINQADPLSKYFQIIKPKSQYYFVSQGNTGQLIFWNSTNIWFNRFYNGSTYSSPVTVGISQNSKYLFALNGNQDKCLLWKRNNKSFQLVQQLKISQQDTYHNRFFNSKQTLLIIPSNPSDEESSLTFYSLCQSHYFYDSQNDKCSQCHQKCLQCFGKSQKSCSICNQNSITSVFTDYECTLCKNIVYGCLKCEIYNQCTQCQYSWSLNSNYKICECIQKNRFLNNQTHQCQCIERFVEIDKNCTKCFNPGCLTCLPVNIDKCIKCDIQNGWIQTLNSTCQCIQSYFYNGIDLKCQSCSTGCQRCVKRDSCQNCYSQFHKQGSATLNSCKCNDKFSFSSEKSCKKCISPCLQCLNQNSCLSCIDGYHLNTQNSICQPGIPFYIYILVGVGLLIIIGVIIFVIKKYSKVSKYQEKESLLSQQEKQNIKDHSKTDQQKQNNININIKDNKISTIDKR